MSVATDPLTPPFPPGPPPRRWRDAVHTARSLLAMATDPLAFVGRRFAAHGDLYHVDEGGGAHLYVTCDPDLMRQVLVDRAQDYRKGGGVNDRLVPFLGDGLLTADGESWKEQRRLVQPRFHGRAIAGYGRTMVDQAEAVRFEPGATVDVSDAMMRLTLNIVCKALFDHEVRGEADDIAATMNAMRRATSPSLLPEWLPTPGRLRSARALRRLDALIGQLIEERTTGGLRDDLLSMLLDVGLDRRLVRDDVVTLFLAGHETTSHALAWTWWLLANHPEVEARLHEELDTVLGGRPPTADDGERLVWTAAVASEAMRLYPPAFAVARVAAVDTELGGYGLAAGSQVVCWIWHCHHSPKWFDQPDAFRPERFLAPTFPKHAYLPFGAGARMCIGAGFARMEITLLLASLARRYRLVAAPGQRVATEAGVTLAPRGGLPLTAVLRDRGGAQS